MTRQGILFVAVGEDHIRAAMHSAETVHKHCPELPIHLFADWQKYDFQFDLSPFPFTSVASIENPHRRSKVDCLPLTPFDQTLYLDNDSALNADIREMFGLLDRFDFALTHTFRRSEAERRIRWRLELPPAFPHFNSGVILYRKNEAVLGFLKEWGNNYHQAYRVDNIKMDETTLRELIWQTDLHIVILPQEYNVRYSKYNFLQAKSKTEAKIYHLKVLHISWQQRFLKSPRKAIGKLLKK